MNNKICVFGTNSYIGTNFIKYCSNRKVFDIYTVSSRGDEWKKINYSQFDAILFVAGIAHVSTTKKLEKLYYSINRDLPLEVAKKAKSDGIRQFVYLSSMIVYGNDLPIGSTMVITKDTEATPSNYYGKSKLQAENAIKELENETFIVSIIRLPMIYGPECKGNFKRLITLPRKFCFFPSIYNQRSMLFIDNLCEFLIYVFSSSLRGVLFPQNENYVSTKEVIQQVSICLQKRVYFVDFANGVLRLLSYRVNFLRKIFSSRVYDTSLSQYVFNYNLINFEESIKRCICNKRS